MNIKNKGKCPNQLQNNLSLLRSTKSYAIPKDYKDPERRKYKYDSHGHIKARKR